jgi:cytochrome c
MEFLDKLVLPQSSEHISLIHFLLMVVLIPFLIFVSILLGGTFLSWYYELKGRKNILYHRFAKDIIESVTISIPFGVILGIVPLFTMILMYAQLLHTSNAITVKALTLSFVLFIIAFILIYTYRYTFSFQGIVTSLQHVIQKDDSVDKIVQTDVKRYSSAIPFLQSRSGLYGLLLLFIAAFFFIGGVTASLHPENWDKIQSFFAFFYSWDVISRFLSFILAAMALTGATLMFLFFYWEGGKDNLDEPYKELIKKVTFRVTLTGVLLLPLFLLFNLWTLPKNALSGSVFGLSVAGIFLVFLAYHFLYAMMRNGQVKSGGYVFMVLVLLFAVGIVKDKIAMSNVTKTHNFHLHEQYLAYAEELRGAGAVITAVSGENIYNTLCVACHQFETRVVGPPYKDVLPKYDDDVEKLADFIRNPVRVNTAYPPMPNQGLRPNEARAVAVFMFERYGGMY